MFKCQFSGEVSQPAEFAVVIVEENITRDTPRKALRRVKEAEKPIRVIVQVAPKAYTNYDAENENYYTTQGSAVVKELLIRAKHLEAVKAKYNLKD